MKQEIYADVDLNINGTSYQGVVDTHYWLLKEAFGEPTDGDGDKVQAEWILHTPFGVATIYDWKSSKQVGDITEWHIGGHNNAVVDAVNDYIANYEKEWYKINVPF
jgi:hypothetical protein